MQGPFVPWSKSSVLRPKGTTRIMHEETPIQIIASPGSSRPQIQCEDQDVLSNYPGQFDGPRFYWDHIGPSAQDLLEIREASPVELYLDIDLSPNPRDVLLELKSASRYWGFWPDPMEIGQYLPAGDTIKAELPDEAHSSISEPHKNLAKRIVSKLVGDGVNLNAEVDYDPSLTPSQVRHIRGATRFEERRGKLAEEWGLGPGDPYGAVKAEFDVGEKEIEDAIEGRGPYAKIEGKHTMRA